MSRLPRSPARFLVPFAMLGSVAVAFALYAWGGIGPSEQELVALAHVPIDIVSVRLHADHALHVARNDTAAARPHTR